MGPGGMLGTLRQLGRAVCMHCGRCWLRCRPQPANVLTTLVPHTPCRLVGSPLVFEYIPLHPGWRGLVDALWRLYVLNGQRHGFHVTCKHDFYRIHLGGTPGLSVLLVRVRRCACCVGWCACVCVCVA